jgi:hypothetical protein
MAINLLRELSSNSVFLSLLLTLMLHLWLLTHVETFPYLPSFKPLWPVTPSFRLIDICPGHQPTHVHLEVMLARTSLILN